MLGTPTRLPYCPHAMRPIDLPPSRSSFVSWSESKESAKAQRAPPFQLFGRKLRPARTWLTRPRQCFSGHCQGSNFVMSLMMVLPTQSFQLASRQRAAGDGYRLPRDPGGVVGSQKRHGVGDILWRAHAPHGDRVDEIVAERGRPVAPLPLVIGAGRHEAGRDRIDGYAERSELLRKLLHEADLSVLGGGIALDAGQAGGEPRPAGDGDDAPPSFCLHPGRDGFCEQESALEIGIDDRVEIISAHLF